MRVFAIGDLHLPGGSQNKSMDVFGSMWENHFEKICRDWHEKVSDDDLVLIPGDISWAMLFEDALADLGSICALPGKKVMIKGNHDYWWSSITKLRQALYNGTYAIQNDAFVFGGIAVAGSRGWEHITSDGKVQRREIMRMEMSLKSAQQKNDGRIIVMMHYPPFDERGNATELTDLFEQYGASDVIYGHLHGDGTKNAVQGLINGINYRLASCDFLDFRLLELL